jgi:hypothetical protein
VTFGTSYVSAALPAPIGSFAPLLVNDPALDFAPGCLGMRLRQLQEIRFFHLNPGA